MKKIIAIAISFALCFCVAGCVQKTTQAGATVTVTQTVTAVPVTATPTGVSTTATTQSKSGSTTASTPSIATSATLKRLDISFTEKEISAAEYRNYSVLSARLKVLYLSMVKAFLSCAPQTDATGFLDNEIHIVFNAVRRDYPQLFWVSNTYTRSTKGDSTTVAFDYAYTYEQAQAMLQLLKQVTAKLLAQMPNGLNAYDKELFIHDSICTDVAYNNGESNPLDCTAYGALVNKSAICEGYSRAAQLLLYCVGIQSSLVTGESGGNGHMWNIVQLDGAWYHLDVTFDDSDDSAFFHTYFNISDEQLLFDHKLDGIIRADSVNIGDDVEYNIALPDCTANSENYFVKNGLLIYSEEVFEQVVFDGLDTIPLEKGQSVEFCFGNDVNLTFETAEEQLHQILTDYRDKNGNMVSLYSTQYIIGSKGFRIVIR